MKAVKNPAALRVQLIMAVVIAVELMLYLFGFSSGPSRVWQSTGMMQLGLPAFSGRSLSGGPAAATGVIAADGGASRLLAPWSTIHQQILDDLAPFAGGIGESLINRTYETCAQRAGLGNCMRLMIIDNTIYVKSPNPMQYRFVGEIHNPTWRTFSAPLFMLTKMLCRHRVPNLELVMSFEEHPSVPHFDSNNVASEPLPLFSSMKTPSHYDILYPFGWFFANCPATAADTTYTFNSTAWEARKDQAVWRGATTCCTYDKDNWNTTIRARLVAKCRMRPVLCDAQFTDIVQATGDAIELINRTWGTVKREPFKKIEERYKYLIVVGGNQEYTASRATDALSSSMTPLWAFTEHIEFFNVLLRPYEHYVPGSKHWGDLFEKLEWCKQNPLLAQRIARQGQQMAGRIINTEFVSAYFAALFSEYAKLLSFAPRPTAEYTRVNITDPAMLRKVLEQAGTCKHWRNVT